MFGFIKRVFNRNNSNDGQIKQYGAMVTGNGQAVWPKRDYENFAKETYLKNLVSFRCIDIISKSVATVDWNVYKRTAEGKREEVTNNPLKSILRRANPRMSWQQLQYDVVAYLLIAGNSYITRSAPIGGPNKGIPKELYVLRPDKVTVKVDPETKQITKYVYKPDAGSEEQDFEVDPVTGECDLLHIKFFHPTDDYYGASIVEASAREIDTNNMAVEWHMNLLQNQARPGLLLIYERMLGDVQHARLKKDIKENEGASGAGGTLILDDIKDAKPYGFTPTEMDFIEGNRDKARMIAAAFGVPAQLLGIRGDQTFSNFEQARLVFWEDTVVYYLKKLKAEYNYWLFGKEDTMFLDYSLENVPALDVKREATWKRVQESNFISDNEKRETVGLGEIGAGNVLWKPATSLPIDIEGDPLATQEDESIDEEDNMNDDEGRLIALMNEGFSREEAEEMIGWSGR